MLRVNAKQGVPKDGTSPIELFQVEIYPLKIHLTETMYKMMWGYLFPGEEQDSQRRQEAWKVSTTSSSRRQKKGTPCPEAATSSSNPARKSEVPGKSSATSVASVTAGTSPHGDSTQVSKAQNIKSNNLWGSTPELRRTSSFDRTWEENLAESVADELVLQANSPRVSSSKSSHQNTANEGSSKNKPRDSKSVKSSRSSHEEKVGKPQDAKTARPRKMMEFHNIKISQVELLLTYEGSRLGLPISDLRLLMDTFHRDEFTGTWTRLFSRVKKHIIWGVLKSVTGMQGKKFKAKSQSQKEAHVVQREAHGVASLENDVNLSDSDIDQPEKSDQLPITWPKRPNDGAGDGFVTSIRGLFNNQRRKAKAFVLRTMRGDAENEFHGEWSESDVEFTPFARQLTITKAKKLIQRHKTKYRPRSQKSSGAALQRQDSHPSSARGTSPSQSDESSTSSSEELNE